jgi:sigma-54-interacting transcriptional regulator
MTQGRSASTLRAVRSLTAEEWRVARIARVNVLFVGSGGVAEKIVDALRPDFCEPIDVWHPASRLVLPPIGGTGTLILQDVGAMPRADQRRLCDWLEVTAGRTRVVSTTRQPLFPLLEAGTFAETLYYRLNVLCFQVTECDG